MPEFDYCSCDSIDMIYGDFDGFYEWDVCSKCDKRIEGSERELNHYDGEDHVVHDSDLY